MTEAMARASSAGIPTSHGSQCRVIRSGASMSHGMDEHRRTQRLGGGQDGFDGRIVQVPIADMGPDLDAVEAELPDASFQLLDRQVRILERDGAEAGEPVRLRGDDLGEVVVQQPRDDGRIGRRLVVGEHDRHRREHLEPDAGPVAVLEAHAPHPSSRRRSHGTIGRR